MREYDGWMRVFLKCYNCMKNPGNAKVSGKNCNGQRNNKFNKTRKKKKKKQEKGYGVTFVPGILVLIKSAAHSAFGLPTSFTLQMN